MKRTNSMRLRFVSVYQVPNHEALLYRLLKERPRSMTISHKRMPTLAEHRKFVRLKPYGEWNFILQDKTILGSIYLSNLNEIGIFLFKTFRGGMLETKVVREFIARRRTLRLLANVSPKNSRYARIFRGLGFKLIQHSYCLEPLGRKRR